MPLTIRDHVRIIHGTIIVDLDSLGVILALDRRTVIQDVPLLKTFVRVTDTQLFGTDSRRTVHFFWQGITTLSGHGGMETHANGILFAARLRVSHRRLSTESLLYHNCFGVRKSLPEIFCGTTC